MSYRIHMDPTHDLVVVVLTGDVSEDDLHAFRADLMAHPDFHPGMRQLIDVREGRVVFDFARSMRHAKDDPFDASARRAALVTDALHFGMARMYDTTVGRGADHLKPVRSLEEAAAHLGVPAAVLDRRTEDPS